MQARLPQKPSFVSEMSLSTDLLRWCKHCYMVLQGLTGAFRRSLEGGWIEILHGGMMTEFLKAKGISSALVDAISAKMWESRVNGSLHPQMHAFTSVAEPELSKLAQLQEWVSAGAGGHVGGAALYVG